MISLAHIINPVVVDSNSDLTVAQPVTFATMKIARNFSGESVDVKLYATQYQKEERIALPRDFIRLPDLNRSVADVKTFKQARNLPLIRDILDRLYEAAKADYLIYSNVDIALQPFFYQLIAKVIEQGYDAFIINRRTISGKYKNVEDIPLMCSELGEKHQGWDCFIFHRSLYPHFQLGNICVGSGWFGRAMITNMAAMAKKFEIFTQLHATFHIGNDKAWQVPEFDDYLDHNKNECRKILKDFDCRYGPFDRQGLPGRFFARL